MPKQRIADPIHGTIELTDVESAIISSPTYQRLRHVKQLGLAYLVFPGADYSRFSHSIGACHITSRILDALSRNCSSISFDDDEVQLYRLAGLLHDVGHYPFSHTMEHAIADHYRSGLLEGGHVGEDNAVVGRGYYTHEDVGEVLLKSAPDINSILAKFGVDPNSVSAIFNRKEPPKLANLISSDLDADRLDYLLRTAHHTGLPYGNVDLSYLLTEMRVDDKQRICLTDKALRAAEHMLLCRYFDYQQVAFNKTVAALEWLLADVLRAMIDAGYFDCSASGIDRQITGPSWKEFDDAHVMSKMREFAAAKSNSVAYAKVVSLLNRRTPKMVGHVEFLRAKEKSSEFISAVKIAKTTIRRLADKFGIDHDLWHLWQKSGVTLTKIGSHMPLSGGVAVGPKDQDRYDQAIRILNKDGLTSCDIMSVEKSLMHILSDNALFSLRAYVLLPDGSESLRADICKEFDSDFDQYQS